MDGNGRWAERRGLPRAEGHVAGVRTMVRTVRLCRRLGVRYLTLYAFSAQNWRRPALEVRALMRLLLRFLRSDAQELVGNGVRLRVLGDPTSLPEPAQRQLRALVAQSRRNSAIDLCLAVSYGGREEIAAAAAGAARAARAGIIEPEEITPGRFRAFMAHPAVPDPDLLIRTSGEMRLSNFLLWQAAYSELVVLDSLWPDFDEEQLVVALQRYSARERRFGKTSAQVQSPEGARGGATSGGAAADEAGAADTAAMAPVEAVAADLNEEEEACVTLPAIEALRAAAMALDGAPPAARGAVPHSPPPGAPFPRFPASSASSGWSSARTAGPRPAPTAASTWTDQAPSSSSGSSLSEGMVPARAGEARGGPLRRRRAATRRRRADDPGPSSPALPHAAAHGPRPPFHTVCLPRLPSATDAPGAAALSLGPCVVLRGGEDAAVVRAALGSGSGCLEAAAAAAAAAADLFRSGPGGRGKGPRWFAASFVATEAELNLPVFGWSKVPGLAAVAGAWAAGAGADGSPAVALTRVMPAPASAAADGGGAAAGDGDGQGAPTVRAVTSHPLGGAPAWAPLVTPGFAPGAASAERAPSPGPWLYAGPLDPAATGPLPPPLAVARARRWGLWLLLRAGAPLHDTQRAVADALHWSAMSLEPASGAV